MHIRNLLVLVTLAACTSGALDSEAEGDGGDGGEPGAEGLAFEEAFLTPAYGAANAVWAGVSLLDYDGDGWLDLFFTNGLNHPDALYRNLGPDSTGRLVFTDVATEAGVDSLALNGASVAGDLDNDGDIDLVVNSECSTGSFDEQGLSYWDGGKLLYHNNGDGTFTQGAFPFFATPGDAEVDFLSLCTYSMSLADMDEDGYLDILLAQGDDPDIIPPWTFRKERGSNQNLILWNDGAGNFDRLSGLSKPDLDNPGGTEYGSETSFAIAAWDVNGDGSTDMVAGNGGFYVHVLTRRDDETFPFQVDWDRSESGHGLWMGLAPADYDGDGDFDIFATNQGLSPLIVGYNNFDDVPFDEGTVVNTHLSMLINEGGVFVPDHDWPVEAEQVLAGDLFDGYYGLHEDLMNPENLQRYGWGWGAVALDYDADGWMDVA